MGLINTRLSGCRHQVEMSWLGEQIIFVHFHDMLLWVRNGRCTRWLDPEKTWRLEQHEVGIGRIVPLPHAPLMLSQAHFILWTHPSCSLSILHSKQHVVTFVMKTFGFAHTSQGRSTVPECIHLAHRGKIWHMTLGGACSQLQQVMAPSISPPVSHRGDMRSFG